MRDRTANRKQQHACQTSSNDAQIAMASKADAEGNNTQRQDNNEHLRVQVSDVEAGKNRQGGENQWQSQAMNETESRQDDGCTVQPVNRFFRILIH